MDYRRPEHTMYEGMGLLFINALLPALVIACANDAFLDYHSIEEIFDIPPPEPGLLHPLRIKKKMMEVPFFQKFDKNGPTGKIDQANQASTRGVTLGHRAGFLGNVTFHSYRNEALVQAESIAL